MVDSIANSLTLLFLILWPIVWSVLLQDTSLSGNQIVMDIEPSTL